MSAVFIVTLLLATADLSVAYVSGGSGTPSQLAVTETITPTLTASLRSTGSKKVKKEAQSSESVSSAVALATGGAVGAAALAAASRSADSAPSSGSHAYSSAVSELPEDLSAINKKAQNDDTTRKLYRVAMCVARSCVVFQLATSVFGDGHLSEPMVLCMFAGLWMTRTKKH